MWGWILPLLQGLLPWLFSGEKKTEVKTHEGLKDMDRVNPGKKLDAKDLPPLLVCVLPFVLSGCVTLGGAKVTNRYHLVEPGAVVECVEGRIKVRSPGTDDVGDYDPVGKVIMSKSVYKEMREAWLKEHGTPQE